MKQLLEAGVHFGHQTRRWNPKMKRYIFGERNGGNHIVNDTKEDHLGVTYDKALCLTIVAVVDTNCDPLVIQHVIPGNDDAIQAGTIMCHIISESVNERRYIPRRRHTRAATTK